MSIPGSEVSDSNRCLCIKYNAEIKYISLNFISVHKRISRMFVPFFYSIPKRIGSFFCCKLLTSITKGLVL